MDGSKRTCDLLVGADGIKSTIKEYQRIFFAGSPGVLLVHTFRRMPRVHIKELGRPGHGGTRAFFNLSNDAYW